MLIVMIMSARLRPCRKGRKKFSTVLASNAAKLIGKMEAVPAGWSW